MKVGENKSKKMFKYEWNQITKEFESKKSIYYISKNT